MKSRTTIALFVFLLLFLTELSAGKKKGKKIPYANKMESVGLKSESGMETMIDSEDIAPPPPLSEELMKGLEHLSLHRCQLLTNRAQSYKILSQSREGSVYELKIYNQLINKIIGSTCPVNTTLVDKIKIESVEELENGKEMNRLRIASEIGKIKNAMPLYQWGMTSSPFIDIIHNSNSILFTSLVQQISANLHKIYNQNVSETVLLVNSPNSKTEDEIFKSLMNKDDDLRKNKIKPLSLDDFHALNKEINQIKISFQKCFSGTFTQCQSDLGWSVQNFTRRLKGIGKKEILIINLVGRDKGDFSPFVINTLEASVYSLSKFEYDKEKKEIKRLLSVSASTQYKQNVFNVTLFWSILFTLFVLLFLTFCFKLLGFNAQINNSIVIIKYILPFSAFIFSLLFPFLFYYACLFLAIHFPPISQEFATNWDILLLLVSGFKIIPNFAFFVFLIRLKTIAKMGKAYSYRWILILANLGINFGHIFWIIFGIIIHYSHLCCFDVENIFHPLPASKDEELIIEEYMYSFLFAHYIQFGVHSLILIFTSYKIASKTGELLDGKSEIQKVVQLVLSIISNILSFTLLFLTFSFLKWILFALQTLNIGLGLSIILLDIIILLTNHVSAMYENKEIVKTPEELEEEAERAHQLALEREENANLYDFVNMKKDAAIEMYLEKEDLGRFIQRIGRLHGMPFVTNRKEFAQKIITNIENRQFGFFLILGARGVGKSRLVYEALSDTTCELVVLEGHGTYPQIPTDFENLFQEGSTIRKKKMIQPFEPIRKILAQIIGVDLFSSQDEQIMALKTFSEDKDTLSALALIFGIDERTLNRENSQKHFYQINEISYFKSADKIEKPMGYDFAFLAEHVITVLQGQWEKCDSKGKNLVIVLENMEGMDKTSLSILRHLIKQLSASHDSSPVTFVMTATTDESLHNAQMRERLKALISLANKIQEPSTDVIEPIHLKLGHAYMLKNIWEHDIHQLLQLMCFDKRFIPELKQWIIKNSNYNLYFTNLLLQHLLQSQLIQPNRFGWIIKEGESLSNLKIPKNVGKLVKLKKFKKRTIKILQLSAEIGWEFSASLISKILNANPVEIIYALSELERKYHIITEIPQKHKKKNTRKGLFQNTHVFINSLYFQSVRLFTRSYGGNRLLPLVLQKSIFDGLFSEINMDHSFLNSFLFYTERIKFPRERDTSEKKEEKEKKSFQKRNQIPIDFKFRLAEHGLHLSFESKLERILSFIMAAHGSQSEWNLDGVIKYSKGALKLLSSVILSEMETTYPPYAHLFGTRETFKDFLQKLSVEVVILLSYTYLEKVEILEQADLSEAVELIGDVREEVEQSFNFEEECTEIEEEKIATIRRIQSLIRKLSKLAIRLTDYPKIRAIETIVSGMLNNYQNALIIGETLISNDTIDYVTRAEAAWGLASVLLRSPMKDSWAKAVKNCDLGVKFLSQHLAQQLSFLSKSQIFYAKELIAKLLTVKGMVLQYKFNSVKECEQCYFQSLKYREDCNSLRGCCISHGLIASFYLIRMEYVIKTTDSISDFVAKQLNDAATHFYKIEEISFKTQNETGLLIAPKGLAHCFLLQKNYEKALYFFEICEERAEELFNTRFRIEALFKIIDILKESGQIKDNMNAIEKLKNIMESLDGRQIDRYRDLNEKARIYFSPKKPFSSEHSGLSTPIGKASLDISNISFSFSKFS